MFNEKTELLLNERILWKRKIVVNVLSASKQNVEGHSSKHKIFYHFLSDDDVNKSILVGHKTYYLTSFQTLLLVKNI